MVGRTRPALLALWSAVGFLLLVACTNVANLLLARSTARASEMAVRAALGARGTRLMRQALTESVVFGACGGALGLVLAWVGIRLLVQFGPADTPRLADAGLQPQVLLFTLALSIATGVVFGLVPASRAGRDGLQADLKEGGRHDGGRSGSRLADALIALQTAVSLVLLIGSTLMARTFVEVMRVDPGFGTDGILTLRLSPAAARYAGEDGDRRLIAFYAQALDRIRALPGVRAAGATNSLYLTGAGTAVNSFSIEGVADPPPSEVPDAHVRSMTVGLHEALGRPVVRGRTFRAADSADATRVALINRTFARRYFVHSDALGKRVSFDGRNGRPIWREIVGIVGDARQEGLDQAVYPEIQVPLAQAPRLGMTLVVRGSGDLDALIGPIRRCVRDLDPGVPVFDVQTMKAAIADSVAARRFSAWLLGVFAVTALVLAACGLYGIVAYRVARSRHEIGVRVALGACPATIVRMVVLRGIRAALVGVIVGLPLAWLLAGSLRSLLFGVALHDATTFAGAALLLLATCVVACYVPARRAARVDPLIALRTE